MYTWPFDNFIYTYHVEYINGYYKISRDYYFLGVNDTEIGDTVRYINSIYEDEILWKITKTETNHFKISPKTANNTDRVISLGSAVYLNVANQLLLNDYVFDTDFSDEWEFIPFECIDNYAFLRGAYYGDTSVNDVINSVLYDATYYIRDVKIENDVTVDELMIGYKTTDFISFLTHGHYDRILINDSDDDCFELSDLVSLGQNGINNVDLVFYGDCLTAFTGLFEMNGVTIYVDEEDNLAWNTYNYSGAKAVIAFSEPLNVSVTNCWAQKFFHILYSGSTISNAINESDSYIINKVTLGQLSGSQVNSFIGSRVEYGNMNVSIY